MLALSLFEERDPARAAEVARELSSRNAERQALERRVVAQARERIGPAPDDALLVEVDAEWHRGVLGIAASRLAREYHRPVLLFGMEGGRVSGSGRSIPGVSLHGILKELSARFTDFGGHDQAVGGSLPAEGFDAFRADARALFRERVPPELLIPRLEADAELPLEAVGESLVRELARLEPHGSGNPRPVFFARGARTFSSFSPVGTSGLRGRLRLPGARPPGHRVAARLDFDRSGFVGGALRRSLSPVRRSPRVRHRGRDLFAAGRRA